MGTEPEITVKLAKRKARIFEIPIRYSGRTYAEGKKITWRDGVKALGALAKYGISDKIYVADAYGSEILARLNRAPRYQNGWRTRFGRMWEIACWRLVRASAT